MLVYLISRDAYALMLAPMILLAEAGVAAVYRAYAIPRWMLWAFSNVRNVHELKCRAQFAWLIPSEENAGVRKFEKWTNPQRIQWLALERKFDLPNEFRDDHTILLKHKSILPGIKKSGSCSLRGLLWGLADFPIF